ncbi:MAG: signal peptidase I [Clostridia bacterium]|nr:signal peptidase I [Clostridia bacterium]
MRKNDPRKNAPGGVTAGEGTEENQSVLRALTRLVIKLLLAGAFLYLLFGCLFGLAVVDSNGMYPALHSGDIILFFRMGGALREGDVVVYQAQSQRHIGRVLATAGDTVDIDGSGALYINGTLKQELVYYSTLPKEESGAEYPLAVGGDEVYILGDLRTAATDSRDFGAVRTGSVTGKVLAVLRLRGF